MTISLLRDDSDAGFIGGGEDCVGIEHEGSASFDGEAGGACGLHGFYCGEADDGYVEAHVLVGFGDLDDGERTAEGSCCLRADAGFGVECAEESTGAGDGGVGPLHGLNGNTGLRGDDDGLAEIVGGDGLGDGASVCDVLFFFFIGRTQGEDAGLCEERLKVLRGGDKLDAFVAEYLRECAEEHVGVAGAEVEKEFGQAPIGANAGEDLFVFDLTGHGGAGDAFGLKGFDEARELAEGEPVDVDVGVSCGAGVDLGVGLFFDGCNDYGEAVGACCVEQEEGEAAVAGDQA